MTEKFESNKVTSLKMLDFNVPSDFSRKEMKLKGEVKRISGRIFSNIHRSDSISK